MHIRTITSSLKNFPPHGITVADHGQYLFIHGPNGSGKSTIVHSLELALCGIVTDAAGRDLRSQSHIKALSSTPDELGVEVIAATDGTERAYPLKTPKHHHVVHDALQAISGSGNALLDYLLREGPDNVVVDIDLTGSYPSWSKWVKLCGSQRAALLKVRGAAKKGLGAVRAEKKELLSALKYHNGGETHVTLKGLLASTESAEKENKALLAQVEAAALTWVRAASKAVTVRAGLFVPLHFYFLEREIRLGTKAGSVPSGAEMVELAIGLAVATRDSETALYILPDRAYDPERLSSLMRLLRIIPCALAVVQSVVVPSCDYNFMDFWANVSLPVGAA